MIYEVVPLQMNDWETSLKDDETSGKQSHSTNI